MRVDDRSIKNALIIAVALVVVACKVTDLPDREADEVAIRALLARTKPRPTDEMPQEWSQPTCPTGAIRFHR